jgi:hypothetical protein
VNTHINVHVRSELESCELDWADFENVKLRKLGFLICLRASLSFPENFYAWQVKPS